MGLIDSPLALAIIRLPVAAAPGNRDAVLWKFGWWSIKELAKLEASASFCDDAHWDKLSVNRNRRLRLPQANYTKGLILAQNERWRRGLGMQVERES